MILDLTIVNQIIKLHQIDIGKKPNSHFQIMFCHNYLMKYNIHLWDLLGYLHL